MFPRFVRVVAGVGTPSSSRLNDTPLCGWTAFAYPASHRWALGWLPLLAVGDGAAVNVGVQVSVGVLTILGKHQEMELLDLCDFFEDLPCSVFAVGHTALSGSFTGSLI